MWPAHSRRAASSVRGLSGQATPQVKHLKISSGSGQGSANCELSIQGAKSPRKCMSLAPSTQAALSCLSSSQRLGATQCPLGPCSLGGSLLCAPRGTHSHTCAEPFPSPPWARQLCTPVTAGLPAPRGHGWVCFTSADSPGSDRFWHLQATGLGACPFTLHPSFLFRTERSTMIPTL